MSPETEIPSRIKTSWLIGIFAALSIFVVIAWYSGHMTRAYTSYDQELANDRYVTLQKLRADENAVINGPADWIDQTKGTIHIPIDEAMVREVETLKSQPAQMGCALPAPAAPPTPASASAAAPAKPDATASTNAAPAAPAAPTPTKK